MNSKKDNLCIAKSSIYWDNYFLWYKDRHGAHVLHEDYVEGCKLCKERKKQKAIEKLVKISVKR